jgi:hypothetical protein
VCPTAVPHGCAPGLPRALQAPFPFRAPMPTPAPTQAASPA